MNFDKLLLPDKNAVIEIENVEYLVEDVAVTSLKNGDEYIVLVRLYDHTQQVFSKSDVVSSLNTLGIIDYLDK